MNDTNETRKWDLLILTVGNEAQKKCFESQISSFYFKYFTDFFVIEDFPVGTKIGSGGATFNVIEFLFTKFGDKFLRMCVLILHSGGYSQRLPHVSAIGKLFLTMPDGRCFLETKLQSYVSFIGYLIELNYCGVFVASADTLEVLPNNDVQSLANKSNTNSFNVSKNIDIILFAHESSLDIAVNHGVYITDECNRELICVLQKPNLDEFNLLKSCMNDGAILTDSCYFIFPELLKCLYTLKKENGLIKCELCCYGDFLRPLGVRPKLEYLLDNTNLELLKWREKLKGIMAGRHVKLINLGKDSFIHLGTNKEMLENFFSNKLFSYNFLLNKTPNNVICSQVDDFKKISTKSFIEFSSLQGNYQIKDGCIISRVILNSFNEEIIIKENTILVGLCLNKLNKNDDFEYITLLFDTNDDLKKMTSSLLWQNHKVLIEGDNLSNLWLTPIFPVANTLSESVTKVLKMKTKGFNLFKKVKKISVKEAIERVNLCKMLKMKTEFS